MKIGIITTWFERGAAYVSSQYKEILEDLGNEVYIYARGGVHNKKDPKWNEPDVWWGKRVPYTKIDKRDIIKWINEKQIECLFFNEQHEFEILCKIKKRFPNIKMGSYIDYYTEDTVPLFDIFDFLICNTKRHFNAFKNHKQVFYIKWGTNVDLFQPIKSCNDTLTFFHSMGMSYRKGTEILINAFIHGKLYEYSKLIIHTQIEKYHLCGMNEDDLRRYNIEIIAQTVTAPGLYYMGDVYVYPTTLEGLGLSIYEAMSCGLPVVITNSPPMNEVVKNEVGRLVDVEELRARADGYYWPQSYCDEKSLINAMKFYVELDRNELNSLKKKVRDYACKELDFSKRKHDIASIFLNSKNFDVHPGVINRIQDYEKKIKKRYLMSLFVQSKLCNEKTWGMIRKMVGKNG